MIDVEALYRKYGPMVLRRCRRLLGDEDRALDAMQETFVSLLKNGSALTETAPSSLLYCMATNVCLNILRAGRGRVMVSDEDVLLNIASSEDIESTGLARQILDQLFRGVRPSTRTIAVMHYVDGMTLEETAAAVGLSVSGVRKRLAALRMRLRELEEDEP
jgi:RNA polymerase sigma-70 factor (ECF subfamily)